MSIRSVKTGAALLPNCVTGSPSRRWAVARGAIVLDGTALRQPRPESGDGHHSIALGKAHDDHSACLRAIAVDRVRLRSDDLAPSAYEEQLFVRRGDLLNGGDVTGLAPLEGDELDALAAAVFATELGQRDALAVTRLGQDEQVRLGLDDAHADDGIPLARQPDADYPGRVAAHCPHFGLGESCELAQGGGQDHVVSAGGDVDPGKLVVVIQADCPNAACAHLLELLE